MTRNQEMTQGAHSPVRHRADALAFSGSGRPPTPALPARAVLGPAELAGLIALLERSEQDLSARVASRAAVLDTPIGAPRSDPVYQRLFFALAGLRKQLASAHEELSRSSTGARSLSRT